MSKAHHPKDRAQRRLLALKKKHGWKTKEIQGADKVRFPLEEIARDKENYHVLQELEED